MRRFLGSICALACAACAGEVDAGFGRGAPQELPLDLAGQLPTDVEPDHVYQCWLGEGVTIARSPSLQDQSLPRIETRPGELVYADIELADGTPARAVALRFLAPAQEAPLGPADDDVAPVSESQALLARGAREHPVEVVVARSSREIDETLRLLRLLLFVTWFASIFTCAGILSWLVRRGLAPLDRLSSQIRSTDEEQLDRTFGLPGDAPEELAPVVDQLNGFVERIREAFEREQAFTAHAAHELRTPLAGLRSTLEVSLSRQREAPEYQDAERACLEITTQLQRLVERLLELARANAPEAVVRRDALRVGELVDQCWLPLSDAAAERGVYILPEVAPELEIVTDRQLLRRVIQNVLENAAEYADPDSPITLVAELDGDDARITCANAAAHVTTETLEHVFEPFWRADSARSATGVHAGLGLALCKSFVELLGGRIDVRADAGAFTVTVEIPGAAPASDAP